MPRALTSLFPARRGAAEGRGVDLGVHVAERHAESLATELRRRLLERRRAEAAAGRPAEQNLETAVAELVDEVAAPLSDARRERVRELILRETVGLGPLEELLADPQVEEVMVNGPDAVYVERGGRIERTDVA